VLAIFNIFLTVHH